MICTISGNEVEFVHVKLVNPPPPSNSLLTVSRRKFCCGSLLPVCGVTVSVTFHLTCVYFVLVRSGLLNGHLLGIATHSVDHMFSLCFDYL